MGKNYSPRFKFEVALAALSEDRSQAKIAEAYGVHPSTVSSWRNRLREKGYVVFAQENDLAEYEKRIAELERLVGQQLLENRHLASCGNS